MAELEGKPYRMVTRRASQASGTSSALLSTNDSLNIEPMSPERTPNSDTFSSDATPTPKPYLFFIALGSLNWATGFVVAVFVVVTLPAETSRLWPYNSTLWLGVLKFVMY